MPIEQVLNNDRNIPEPLKTRVRAWITRERKKLAGVKVHGIVTAPFAHTPEETRRVNARALEGIRAGGDPQAVLEEAVKRYGTWTEETNARGEALWRCGCVNGNLRQPGTVTCMGCGWTRPVETK